MRTAVKSVLFTESAVENLALTSTARERREYRDTRQRSLVLRVGKTTKTYYLYLRATGAGSEQKVRLGRHPEMTVVMARRRVQAVLNQSLQSVASSSPQFLPDDELLTTNQAAALTKMSVIWFKKMRGADLGPPYLRKGRTIRYLKRELLEWWTSERLARD